MESSLLDVLVMMWRFPEPTITADIRYTGVYIIMAANALSVAATPLRQRSTRVTREVSYGNNGKAILLD